MIYTMNDKKGNLHYLHMYFLHKCIGLENILRVVFSKVTSHMLDIEKFRLLHKLNKKNGKICKFDHQHNIKQGKNLNTYFHKEMDMYMNFHLKMYFQDMNQSKCFDIIKFLTGKNIHSLLSKIIYMVSNYFLLLYNLFHIDCNC